MNLAEMRVAVDRRSGVAFDTAALTDLINEALAEVTLAADWPWLRDTHEFDATTDLGEEDLPEGFRRIVNVTVGGYESFPSSYNDLASWDYGYSNGRHSFAVVGSTLHFRPTQTTGTAVVVNYVADEVPLEGDADEPLLPEQYHYVLVNLATAYALERVGNLARAKVLRDRYEEGLRLMRRSALRQGGNTGRIRVRPGGGI